MFAFWLQIHGLELQFTTVVILKNISLPSLCVSSAQGFCMFLPEIFHGN